VAAHCCASRIVGCFALTAWASGCGASIVPLLDQANVPWTNTPARAVPLEVITHKNAAVREPLPVRGTRVAFADLETALGHAVASGTVPWAEEHRARRPEGWQLTVELIDAQAHARGEAITVAINVRATLRTRVGNQFLAQTQAHCLRTAAVSASGSAPVALDCMARSGKQLGGWLGGVEP
jgi:hypothetical protein